MKTNKTLLAIETAAAKGEFVKFSYTKEDGEKSERIVRFGGDIPKRLAKNKKEINGKGSWMTGYSEGLRGMIVQRGKDLYVRGTDTSDSQHKIFRLKGIRLKK